MNTNLLKLLLIVALITIISNGESMAQLPHDFRSEQVALSPQQTSCFPGDSVIVQGQVTCLAANRILPFSNYVYVELISPSDSVLVRQKVSCKDKGAFVTSLPVDPLGGFGIYYIRAYTTLMRNFSPESFAVEPLLVGKSWPDYDRITTDGMKCAIVPHGGRLCSGTLQNMTVRLSNYLDDPLGGIEVKLVSESGDEVCMHRTSASGLAVMAFIPQSGVKYTIEYAYDGVKKTFAVPDCEDAKPKIEASMNGAQVAFAIKGGAGDVQKMQLYAYDRLNGISRISLNRLAGSFRLENAPQVVTLFLTDENSRLLAECTAMARLADVQQPTLPQVASVGQPISIPDFGDDAKVMARLVPQNARWVEHAESQLCYLSDLSSPLPFPEHYYELSLRERSFELKAWLGTASFKRFDIGDVVARDSSVYTYMPDAVMYFEGKVETPSKKPFNKGMLVAYNTETSAAYNADINEYGEFQIAVDDFVEGTQFYLQAVDEKSNPQAMYIKLVDDTYPAPMVAQRKTLGKNVYASSEVSYEGGNWNNQELPEITVKARTNYDNLHSTDRFYGNSIKSRKVIEERGFLTLYDILKDMPGLRVIRAEVIDEGEEDDPRNGFVVSNGTWGQVVKPVTIDYAVYPTRGMSTLGGGNEVVMLVDGSRTVEPLKSLMEMPAAEIEEVEYLRPWQALNYTYGAIAGAVNITTRKREVAKDAKSYGTMYSPIGLAPSVEAPLPVADKPGKYRLIVDVVSPSGIHSYESEVTIVAQ